MSDVDNTPEGVAPLTPAALPPGSETQGSAPASEVTSATPEELEAEKADRQSRSQSRAYATQRREIRDLNRQLGHLQAQLESRPTADGEAPQVRITPAQRAYIQKQGEIADMVRERLEEAGEAEGIENFDKVLKSISADGFPMTMVIRDYLGESDRSAAMAKWLSDNPDEAQRISLLSEAVAVRALERAESKLGKAVPRTTRALAPVRTVGGSATASPDPSKMPMDEYVKWRRTRS